MHGSAVRGHDLHGSSGIRRVCHVVELWTADRGGCMLVIVDGADGGGLETASGLDVVVFCDESR